MKQLRIGITGATGFIGMQLLQHFIEAGHSVAVLTRSPEKIDEHANVTVYSTDLAQPDTAVLSAFTASLDVLYHLAGELSNEANMQAVNVEGTGALLEAMDYSKTRLIHLSSMGIFDFKNEKITEESTKAPFNTYEKTKLAAEELIEKEEMKGLKVVVLRPSIVLGHQMKSSLLTQLLRLIRFGIDLKVGAKTYAKVVLAEDLIRALKGIGTKDSLDGQRYNFSNDIPLKTLLTHLKVAVGSRFYFPFAAKLFQLGLRLGRALGMLRISREGIAFFSSTSTISNEKIKRDLDFEFTADYRPFLQEYVTYHT